MQEHVQNTVFWINIGMKSTTLKVALAVITTVGSIAVAALTLLGGGDEKTEPAPAAPSIVLSPSMNQSSINSNTNTATNQSSKPERAERPPVVNNYIIQPAEESPDEEYEEIVDDTGTIVEP